MAKLVINTSKTEGTIAPEIYGHFSEHLGRCIYEGIYVGEDSEIPNTKGMRNDVVAALKAEMSGADFAKLGLDGDVTSIELARVLAENPQLASNQGLTKFLDTHFDDQQRFTFSEGVEPRMEHSARKDLDLPKVDNDLSLKVTVEGNNIYEKFKNTLKFICILDIFSLA